MDNNQGYYDSATPNPSGDYAYGKTITFTITYEFCSANYPAVGSGDVKEYYGYSNSKAKVALDILDKKQLNLRIII